jgi:hypothetical protein
MKLTKYGRPQYLNGAFNVKMMKEVVAFFGGPLLSVGSRSDFWRPFAENMCLRSLHLKALNSDTQLLPVRQLTHNSDADRSRAIFLDVS